MRVRIDLIIAIVMVAALAVAYGTVYAPRQEALSSISSQVDQLERELHYLAGHSGELDRFAQLLPAKREGGESGDQRFLSAIADEARRAGLALSRIEPMGEEPSGQYLSRTYRLQIDGSYSGFANLLESLERFPEVVIVRSLEVRSSLLTASSRSRLELELSVVGY